jgi:carboxypeptidase C (cathepsin A)
MRYTLLFHFLFLAAIASYSQEKKDAKATFDLTDPALIKTKHSLLVGGKTINYTATIGYMVLRKESGEPRAKMFFTAYTLDGVSDPAKRAITYAFNGGPGSSSVWLHMGAANRNDRFWCGYKTSLQSC